MPSAAAAAASATPSVVPSLAVIAWTLASCATFGGRLVTTRCWVCSTVLPPAGAEASAVPCVRLSHSALEATGGVTALFTTTTRASTSPAAMPAPATLTSNSVCSRVNELSEATGFNPAADTVAVEPSGLVKATLIAPVPSLRVSRRT